jgi:hypothetical protein
VEEGQGVSLPVGPARESHSMGGGGGARRLPADRSWSNPTAEVVEEGCDASCRALRLQHGKVKVLGQLPR